MDHTVLLIEQVLAGDTQAFEQLVRRYHRFVYAHVRGWTKNQEDVQEIMQDVFLKVHQNLSTLKQLESFEAWLRKIMRFECYKRLRKKPEFQGLSRDLFDRAMSFCEGLAWEWFAFWVCVDHFTDNKIKGGLICLKNTIPINSMGKL